MQLRARALDITSIRGTYKDGGETTITTATAECFHDGDRINVGAFGRVYNQPRHTAATHGDEVRVRSSVICIQVVSLLLIVDRMIGHLLISSLLLKIPLMILNRVRLKYKYLITLLLSLWIVESFERIYNYIRAKE